jgi:hypothetical protein
MDRHPTYPTSGTSFQPVVVRQDAYPTSGTGFQPVVVEFLP